MANLLSSISNGIVSGSNISNQVSNLVGSTNIPSSGGLTEDIVVEARSPNRDRPRVSSNDPTQKISSNKTTAVLSYPIDRPKYYMSFGFMQYTRPSQFRGLDTSGITDYITLPIPTNLIDSSNFSYAPEEGSLAVDAVASSLTRTGSVDFSTAGIGQLLQAGGAGAMGEAVRSVRGIAQTALGSPIVNGVGQLAGIADNPMLTVMFNGTTFKQHSFTWKLSPRSANEADQVQKIINTLKRVSHPELLTAALGGFYKFPSVVAIKFNPSTAANKMYRFKPAVITNVTINWQPNDRAAFHLDDAPVDMIMTIDFLEIELWRNSDATSNSIAGFDVVTQGDFDNVTNPPIRDLGTI